MKSISIDSFSMRICRAENLGELLARNTSLFFKTYGQGGMSTVAFRGTNASQSGVFWNGFNIEGRSTAMTDLSLVPSFFFNKVDVLYGGSASLFGSGNIGGSIHFSETAEWNQGLNVEAGMSYGSFADIEPRLKIKMSAKNWASVTALLYHQAQNDFPYSFGGKDKKQENAAIKTKAFYQQLDHRFNDVHSLNVAFWLQEDDRQLPAPATGSASLENRSDRSFRFSSRWKAVPADDQSLSAGFAIVHDELHYLNKTVYTSQVLVDSRILNDAFMLEGNAEKRFGKYWQMSAHFSLEHSRADVNSFGGANAQQQGGLLVSMKKTWKNHKWVAAMHVRQELAEGYEVPICPSAGIEGKLGKHYRIYGNASKNFRIPSLNDRFWVPGGNENLLPETSLNAETGIHANWAISKAFDLDMQLAAFASDIHDQIVWIPSGSLWQAQNVQRLAISGMEIKIMLSHNWGRNFLKLDGDYTYVSSINRDKSLPNDASNGKQQIYTPRHRALAKITLRAGNWMVWARTSYNGLTYCTRDNSGYLPAYFITDLGFNFQLPWPHTRGFELGASLNNVLDQQYQVIQYYPAAGRQFRINLNWTFNSPAKH